MFSSNTTQVSDGGYQISRSLRFNSADSTYLVRTPSSNGSQTTSTASLWVKRSVIGAEHRLIAFDQGGSGTIFWLFFNTSNQLQIYTSGTAVGLTTTQVFRDPSAWYHIVVGIDTTQTTGTDRIKLYVNGSQITAFTGTQTYYSQGASIQFNNTGWPGQIGYSNSATLSGYMTEVNWIDGTQLTPSSFGETDTQTGVWKPKAYSGSYGTNGFYLNFSDNSNTTAATLGKDYSGNGNNWTPNNFSVTAGAGNDSLVDSPTSYGTDTGVGGTVRGNYCTLNPLDKSQYVVAPVNGNLDVLNAGNFVEDRFVGTIAVNSGKWYFETTITGTYANTQIGIHDANSAASTNTMYRTYVNSGSKQSGGTTSAYGNSFTTNDILGVAVDMDSGKIWFSKNGTFQASGDPVAGTNAAFTDLSGTITPLAVDYAQAANGTSGHNLNFGQRPFAYTAPSGFKALCTQNLPTPTIGATTATQANTFFAPALYTGNDGTQTVTTGIDMATSGGLVWFKNRSAAVGHALINPVVGYGSFLQSNTTGAENAFSFITATSSTGFTMNTGSSTFNGGAAAGGPFAYVAWNWKANGSGSTNTSGSITSTVSANTTSGFSVVTFTGTNANATIGHGLGVAPAMIIMKVRNAADDSWHVYHKSLTSAAYRLQLNSTAAEDSQPTVWNSTAPTSTVFSVGNNVRSLNQVAYCFAEVAGYSAFGKYTGNGLADGPFVYLGFRPAYIMIKSTDANGWIVMDSKRNTYNIANTILQPNTSGADSTDSTNYAVDFLSNGFKLRNSASYFNGSGVTLIYAAFAENPFKFSLAR